MRESGGTRGLRHMICVAVLDVGILTGGGVILRESQRPGQVAALAPGHPVPAP